MIAKLFNKKGQQITTLHDPIEVLGGLIPTIKLVSVTGLEKVKTERNFDLVEGSETNDSVQYLEV